MDGTLYLDDRLFDGVKEFLARIRERGGRYLFLTNNSSRGVESYMEKLGGMGIRTERRDYLTSVDAAIDCLRRRYPGKRCYVQGTRSFYGQLAAAGIPVTCDREDGVDILLSGFDRELTFQKLEDACILLERGAVWLATNPDWACPTLFGFVPDCGAICELISRGAGRKPAFIGKPDPAMIRLALEQTGYTPEETLMAGDRLYPDIACGINAGVDTALVLTGEATAADAAVSDTPPSLVCRDMADLLERLKEERGT